jgi:hypothetical protein
MIAGPVQQLASSDRQLEELPPGCGHAGDDNQALHVISHRAAVAAGLKEPQKDALVSTPLPQLMHHANPSTQLHITMWPTTILPPAATHTLPMLVSPFQHTAPLLADPTSPP